MKDRLEKDCVIKTLKAMENILYEGTTDVDLFSRPFEIEMLKNEYLKKELCGIIVTSIMTGKLSELKLHKLGHVLLPKKKSI